MTEHFEFSKCQITVSKYSFDKLFWISFFDFTDSIQIYLTRSQIKAFLEDIENLQVLNRDSQIKCQSGNLSYMREGDALFMRVSNEICNNIELEVQLVKPEIKKIICAVKKVLDWDEK